MPIRWTVLCALLAVNASLLAWSASQQSPTLNEPGLLAAGLNHWHLQRFELYRVNPPLVRMVATLPLVVAGAKTDWSGFYEGPGARPEFAIGADFVAANGPGTAGLTTLARWACMPFSLLGASVCYRWGRELYGTQAGLLAAALWCFSPTILGHGSLATSDVACAALALAASYCFWRWLRTPSWRASVLSGIVLGLAQLTKMTAVVLYPLCIFFWLAQRWSGTAREPAQLRARDAGMLCLLLLISLYVVNLEYLFDGSGTRLGDFVFVSDLLSGNAEVGRGNRLASGCLARIPIPLPKDYVLGADAQRHDFEHTQTASYLGGRFQAQGRWYYYLYALAVKTPLGSCGLLLLTVFLRLTNSLPSASWRSDLFLLAPAAAVLALVSAQSGFSQHSRYVIPMLPFLFIWVGQMAQAVTCRFIGTSLLGLALLAWSVASSLAIYPHSLSYFNELAGGPEGGHRHLLGSDLDWGQDLLYLKNWSDQRPDARPLFVGCVAMYGPKDLGIDCVDAHLPDLSGVGDSHSLLRGWYAISINELCRWRAMSEGAYFCRDYEPPRPLHDLAHMQPVARIGYTIYIFHVPGAEDAGGE
jgi:hypothetical protein